MPSPTSVPSWVSICTSIALIRVITCNPLTPYLSLSTPPSSPDLSVPPALHPFKPPQNISTTTTFSTWPQTPFEVPIPYLTAPTTLTVLSTGPLQSPLDQSWLLAAIAHQQSVYHEGGDQPQRFNIFNDRWRFYMDLGRPPPTMAMAVRALQVYEGLVKEYGMAPTAFVVSVGDDVRGFYWVTVKGGARVGVGSRAV